MAEEGKIIPRCIGMIMDGNRRWAKARGLRTIDGHQQGVETLKDMARAVRDRGIPHLVVYAFSTENWKRSDEEVTFMLDLIRKKFSTDLAKELGSEGVRIRVAGQRERFPEDIQEIFAHVETDTAHNDRMTLWICASYGGRAEIVTAARSVSATGKDITEESIQQHLWTAGMPDPDIVIRPGGQRRLSNFLMWQSAYSELFFVDAYWPDFTVKMLDGILAEFSERQRNFGK